MSNSLAEAIKMAKESQMRAHCPYSNFKVGAAVKAKGHAQWFGGCNVENASYGLTICAERVAIFNMIAELGMQEIETLVLVTDTAEPASPCGACRQVISEFSNDTTSVVMCSTSGGQRVMTVSELLPCRFTATDLNEKV